MQTLCKSSFTQTKEALGNLQHFCHKSSRVSIRYPQKSRNLRARPGLCPHTRQLGISLLRTLASPLLTLSVKILFRQDLHLRRAMLTGLLPAYVDRFARVWHRLSTTDTRRFFFIIAKLSSMSTNFWERILFPDFRQHRRTGRKKITDSAVLQVISLSEHL